MSRFRLFFAVMLLAATSCQRRADVGWMDAGRTATVLLFVAPECPISNAYAPEFNRIEADYGHKGVAVFAVHVDPSVTAEIARQHASAFGYRFPVLLDPRQRLARQVGATVTPEAALLDARGNVVYLGRIDDLFVDLGKRRVAATKHELRDALDAVIAGRAVETPAAPAVGCELPPSGSE